MGDSLIAGIVLAHRGILLTRNRRHFERVPEAARGTSPASPGISPRSTRPRWASASVRCAATWWIGCPPTRGPETSVSCSTSSSGRSSCRRRAASRLRSVRASPERGNTSPSSGCSRKPRGMSAVTEDVERRQSERSLEDVERQHIVADSGPQANHARGPNEEARHPPALLIPDVRGPAAASSRPRRDPAASFLPT